MSSATVHLGFEVGTGIPVRIPLAHTFVTGQTQLSGKTTTLRAIVDRAVGTRALAFVTKRGERFEGPRIAPYLPREGEQPIHWRLVETILASALGQRSLKYERLWIVNAAKGAKSLNDVRRNVDRLKAKAKGNTADVYMLLGEYLDLVLPEMQALRSSHSLDLGPGLNVMDLGGVGPQLQALLIRASLERINQHERGVLTVFPEAWEFAPRGRSAPAKDEAIAMARKGAVLGNYLLCDSQDLAGVDTVLRQAASVWILGVQRELNELKRTIDSIPAGITRPKAADVATLGLGQFFACWGRHAIKTYVQPVGMTAAAAERIARGDEQVPTPAPKQPEEETDMSAIESKLDRLADLIQQSISRSQPASAPVVVSNRSFSIEESQEFESLYQAIKQRLQDEAPAILKVLISRPELQVKIEREVIEVAGDSLRGRIALLIRKGFFDAPSTGYKTWQEINRLGAKPAKVSVYTELKALAKLGFLTAEGDGYQAVEEMKANVKA